MCSVTQYQLVGLKQGAHNLTQLSIPESVENMDYRRFSTPEEYVVANVQNKLAYAMEHLRERRPAIRMTPNSNQMVTTLFNHHSPAMHFLPCLCLSLLLHLSVVKFVRVCLEWMVILRISAGRLDNTTRNCDCR